MNQLNPFVGPNGIVDLHTVLNAEIDIASPHSRGQKRNSILTSSE
jgi:hypothetical protein